MLALGIILVLLALGAIVAALFGGSGEPAAFDLGLFEVQTHTLGAFLFGAATVLILVIGLEMIRSGLRRARRRRQERKELNRLTEKLEARDGHADTSTATVAPAAGDTRATGTRRSTSVADTEPGETTRER